METKEYTARKIKSAFNKIEKDGIKAYGNSTVEAYDRSTVEAYNKSTVDAHGDSTVKAYNISTVEAYDNSTVEAYNKSYINCCSTVECVIKDNSIVRRWDLNTIQYASDKLKFEKILA